MNKYVYNGPVMECGTCVVNRWETCTFAVSEKKARNNLTYQFKKNNNKMPNTKITLPGELIAVQ